MYFNSIRLLGLLTLIAPAFAIIKELHEKCYAQIARAQEGYPHTITSPVSPPDPFPQVTVVPPSGTIPVHNFNNCFVRFQNPNDSGRVANTGNSDASCVTRLNWDTTPEGVAATINNFDNRGNSNNQLWLDACPFALQYAGILSRVDPAFRAVIPQPDINTYNTVVSLILPSGVRKLEIVNAGGGLLSRENERRTVGIHGISGKLEPGDYAYATVGDFRAAFADMWVRNEPDQWFIDAIDGELNCVKISLADVRGDKPWQRPSR
ncbi:MAG: hypothetical protein L6R40_006085 [Gallowayella cf. fulva]|nr:MAG: hypothetical protein L6R40_006085 [Xanthomendoza cf. fulva]